MKIQSLLIRGIAAVTLIPAMAFAQANGPARAAGPRSFAQWDKIEITVETKYGNNLAILHGSPKLDTTHPDAAGGRVMALYGPDGVLMVDSQDEELTQKTIDTVVGRQPVEPRTVPRLAYTASIADHTVQQPVGSCLASCHGYNTGGGAYALRSVFLRFDSH